MSERQQTLLIACNASEDRARLREGPASDPAPRYVIIEAESGVRAIELCRERSPDCLILDNALPDLAGIDVVKQLTAEGLTATCRTILLIGPGDTQLAVEAMKSGACDCLEKGRARGEELRFAVSRAIEKTERQGQVARAAAGSRRVAVSRSERASHNQAVEEKLRETNEAQFRAILDHSTALIFIKDLEGHYLRINHRYEVLFGVTESEVIGKTNYDVHAREIADAFHANDREVISANRPLQFEERAATADGVRHFTVVKSPLYDEGGRPYGVCGIATDITDIKRSERESQECKESLLSALDAADVGIWRVDLQTSMETRDAALNRIIGLPEQTLILPLSDWFDRIHPDEAPRARESWGRAMRTGLYDEEHRVVKTDGKVIWVRDRGRIFHDLAGEPLYATGATTDISARKQAEENLRQSESRFRATFENAAVGIAHVALDGRWLEVNQRLCDIVGYSCEELQTKTFGDITHPDDLDGDWEQARRLSAGEIENYSMEKRYYRKDGSIVWINLTGSLMREADGSPHYFIAVVEDISARKLAEGEVKESEERLKLAMKAGDIGMADWLISDDVILLSKKTADIYGLHPDKTTTKYEDWRELVYPEDLPAVEEHIWGTFERKLPQWHVEYRIVRADDGEVRWIESHHHIFYDAQGAPLRTVGATLDITERKRSEETLKLSEERLSLALKVGAIGSFDWDIPTDKAILTGKYCAIFGLPLSMSTCTYEDWRRRVHPSDISACEASLQDAYEHRLEEWLARYRILRADTGELRWVESRSRIFYDAQGAPLRVLGTILDNTDRILAEEARRESEARLRQLADAMPQIVYTCGPDGLVDYVNQQWNQYVGVPVEQSTGRKWMEAVHPDDLESMEQRVRQSAETGQPFDAEYRLRRKDGQYRWHLSRAIPIRNAQGRIVKWIGTATDIHDRKQAEAMREELLACEHSARETAEAASRSKDEFLALVSHELRSPLSAILGYASMMRHGELDAQKIKHAADVIERSGKAQKQLIDDLMDTARIISGKLRLEVRPVDLASVIEQAVQTIRPAADAKGVSLETKFPSEISQIAGDPARLQQVIWNLLSNAIKFTPQAGRVLVRLERVDPYIRITVSDTGKGIATDFLPRVFDRFSQADSSSARRYGGLGLGLALVKYLVELHGGTIEAASAGEGQGSTFTVTLPVRAVTAPLGEARVGVAAVKNPAEARMLAGVRALVVDDMEEACALIASELMQYGADVVAVGSAAEAYELITTAAPGELPDVILSDIEMPDEDGYSLIRRVREWEGERGLYIPAVALTAYGRIEDRVRALKAGFQMHVAKPVEPTELPLVVKSLVNRGKASHSPIRFQLGH